MIRPDGIFAIPPRTRFRGHAHDGDHICAVVAGGFVERCGRGWVDVGPGTVRVSPAARHDIDFAASGARCMLLQPGTHDLRTPSTPRFLEPDPWLRELCRGLERGLDESTSPLELDGLTTEFLAQVARRLDGRATPPPPWLARVRDRVHDAPAPLCVSDLAAEVGVHRVHLARAFREHCGTSVTGYMRRVRMERAMRLLAAGRLTLAEIAAAAGFADQSHLTRSVRAALGTTPGALRRATLHAFKTRPTTSP